MTAGNPQAELELLKLCNSFVRIVILPICVFSPQNEKVCKPKRFAQVRILSFKTSLNCTTGTLAVTGCVHLYSTNYGRLNPFSPLWIQGFPPLPHVTVNSCSQRLVRYYALCIGKWGHKICLLYQTTRVRQ